MSSGSTTTKSTTTLNTMNNSITITGRHRYGNSYCSYPVNWNYIITSHIIQRNVCNGDLCKGKHASYLSHGYRKILCIL